MDVKEELEVFLGVRSGRPGWGGQGVGVGR